MVLNKHLIFLCVFTTMICSGLTYKYSSDVEGYLKLHKIPATWNDAHSQCIQEGAHLATPINDKFHAVMLHFIKDNNICCGVLTGLHDKYTPGYFTSIESVPMDKITITWSENIKCPIKSGQLVVLRADGYLDSGEHSDAYPYICFKKNHYGKDSSQEYKEDHRTGSYYKFHSNDLNLNWYDAAKVCAREDAHLAIINSQVEAQVLKEIIDDKLPGTNPHESALIGISNWGPLRGWLTIQGQTLDEAGFSSWGATQPDHYPDPYGTELFCGALFRSGFLDDVICSITKPFICEKSSPAPRT